MRLRILGCLLLSLTACTSESGPRAASSVPTPTPTATGSPSPLPSPAASALPAADSLLLAVADKRGGLALYAVSRGSHSATLVRRLDGPPRHVVNRVSLSSGNSPTACVVWGPADVTSPSPRELRCYRPGSGAGRLVSDKASYDVGVRADGRALAWTEGNQDLVIADLAGDVATVRARMPYAEGAPPGGYPEGLGDLDWIGARTLVGTAVGDSDESIGLCVIDLDHPRGHPGAGFGRCLRPQGAEAQKGYAHFEEAALVAPGEAVVVERGQDCCGENDDAPAGRAVRLRLSDGAVLGVFATPRDGREVVDVSGGARAVLYTTARDGKELAVSLRRAGEARGAPLTGLPTDLLLATAQP
ncbi:MAG: hypothetical protein JJD92_03535 [Frankiaceae bacterium]|nr:hypothetical protein [Frankiaceae bacterium]